MNADSKKDERRGGDPDGKASLAEAGKNGNGQTGGDAREQGAEERQELLCGPEGRIGRNGRGVLEVFGAIVRNGAAIVLSRYGKIAAGLHRNLGGTLMNRATIVVDNFCQRQGLYAEWGFSVFIETPSGNLLWDTGGILHVLLHNLRALGIRPERIENVALSHGHFDHASGLADVLRMAPSAKLWASREIARLRWGDADASRASGGGPLFAGLPITAVEGGVHILPEVIAFTVPESERDSRFVVFDNMFETGSAGEKIPDTFADDVSLLVRGDNGWSVVLGCAHAGLPNILNYAMKEFGIKSFDAVTGGTHLSGARPEELPVWMDALSRIPVRRWRVNHCTGFKAAAALARRFDDVDWAGAGSVLDI